MEARRVLGCLDTWDSRVSIFTTHYSIISFYLKKSKIQMEKMRPFSRVFMFEEKLVSEEVWVKFSNWFKKSFKRFGRSSSVISKVKGSIRSSNLVSICIEKDLCLNWDSSWIWKIINLTNPNRTKFFYSVLNWSDLYLMIKSRTWGLRALLSFVTYSLKNSVKLLSIVIKNLLTLGLDSFPLLLGSTSSSSSCFMASMLTRVWKISTFKVFKIQWMIFSCWLKRLWRIFTDPINLLGSSACMVYYKAIFRMRKWSSGRSIDCSSVSGPNMYLKTLLLLLRSFPKIDCREFSIRIT